MVLVIVEAELPTNFSSNTFTIELKVNWLFWKVLVPALVSIRSLEVVMEVKLLLVEAKF